MSLLVFLCLETCEEAGGWGRTSGLLQRSAIVVRPSLARRQSVKSLACRKDIFQTDPNCMPELRKDPITGRWVIIAPDRAKRPNDFEAPVTRPAETFCPFCEGNESASPAEIVAYRNHGSLPNGPGWRVRCVPNKFPALQIEGDVESRGVGMYDVMQGIGAHEVILDCPQHERRFSEIGRAHV